MTLRGEPLRGEPLRGEQLRRLIVHDNQTFLKTAARMLKYDGFSDIRTASTIAPLLAAAGAAAVIAISGAPNALADSSNRVAVCSSEVSSGVEVDDCVPNPNANITDNVPGVEVELEGGIGVGLG